MEKYVELDNRGTQTFTRKNSANEYLFRYVRDCTYEENIIHSHSMNRQYPGGYHVMRLGFYRIIRIFEMNIHTLGNEWVAQVAYKENTDDPFIDLPISMRLQPLFNYVSLCDEKDFYKNEPLELLNKEIQIHSSDLVDTEFQGQPSQSYKVKWSILNYLTKSGSDLSDEEIIGGDSQFINNEEIDLSETYELSDAEWILDYCEQMGIDPEDFDPSDFIEDFDPTDR